MSLWTWMDGCTSRPQCWIQCSFHQFIRAYTPTPYLIVPGVRAGTVPWWNVNYTVWATHTHTHGGGLIRVWKGVCHPHEKWKWNGFEIHLPILSSPQLPHNHPWSTPPFPCRSSDNWLDKCLCQRSPIVIIVTSVGVYWKKWKRNDIFQVRCWIFDFWIGIPGIPGE